MLVFLRLGVSISYIWGLVFLPLRVIFLNFVVRDCSVLGLDYSRLGVTFLTFEG